MTLTSPINFLSFAITRATAPLVRGIAEECGELDYGVGGIQSDPSIKFVSKFEIDTCQRRRLIN